MSDDLFSAAGGLSELYAQVDWAATPLRAPESWSPTLRRSLRLVFDTGFPTSLFWGPEFALVYNEAFVRLIGDKHPSALGAPAAQVFEEAWEIIGPLMKGVTAGSGAIWEQDAPVPLTRGETLQEAFFTFSYSPVHNEHGEIEGVMDIATETTRQVVDRRRLVLLSRLREVIADAEELGGLAQRIMSILREGPMDLPQVAYRGLAADGPETEADVPHPGPALELELDVAGEDGRPAALVVAPSDQLDEDVSYLPFLHLVASTVGQGLQRADLRAREREAAAEERLMSEALQRALLTEPPRHDELRVAVRYVPAAIEAEVGGDWYDAFTTPDGGLALVIGDVTGHDRDAAAAMGQVRNILRGIAHTLREPADRILAELDDAMTNLGVDILATAILAQLEPAPSAGGDEPRRLRWSNAGHPPPVYIPPSGQARLMESTPDALLGLGRRPPRRSHELALQRGGAVVFYTDGLVERRGAHPDEGFRWLCDVLQGRAAESPEAIADHVIEQLGAAPDDDVALLVLAV